MSDIVLFPDAVALVTGYLDDLFGIHVGSRVPDPRPSEFVTVRRGGGVRHDLVVDAAQLLIESWADQPETAHDNAQIVRAYLHALAGQVVDGVTVYRVEELSGLADLPDPLSNQPRIVFTVLVHVRGSVAVGS